MFIQFPHLRNLGKTLDSSGPPFQHLLNEGNIPSI